MEPIYYKNLIYHHVFYNYHNFGNWRGLILILILDQSYKSHLLNNCCDQASTYDSDKDNH